MAQHNYRVERHMQGDKAYVPGDVRTLLVAEAAQMVRVGALTDLGPVEPAKAEQVAENKMESPVEDKAADAPKKPLKSK